MKTLAIITARGGSKRIPRKNIKAFNGIPIIFYPIQAAIASGLFDEVMVSTEDEQIAEIARSYGASVPFMRSAETADDYATTADVIIEVLNMYQQKKDMHFDHVCCMYPTAPFATAELLKTAYEKLIYSKRDCIVPIVPFDYPIQRALVYEGERVKMHTPEFAEQRSQDLVKAYHDSGQFYWLRSEAFLKTRSIWGDNPGAFFLSKL